jgi:FixJ family two-component response regulator
VLPVIAIIDDDNSVRVATESLVMSLGYGARAFASAEEFLHSPSIDDVTCLVADVQLSGMNGIELQGQLTQQGFYKPFIFITAFPDDKIRERALRQGAAGFLIKPFDGNVLVECLETALSKK